MMSHSAAIVCREYGLPAVTGTGSASTTIKTGQRLRAWMERSTVQILDAEETSTAGRRTRCTATAMSEPNMPA